MAEYNSGEKFVRATEMKPFTAEHKTYLMNVIESLLVQAEIHLIAQPKSVDERITIMETLFKTLMDYPEFLSQQPVFRTCATQKINELTKDIKNLGKPESKVLNDAKFYMLMLSARPDYVLTQSVAKNTHMYNLRPRVKRMRYE